MRKRSSNTNKKPMITSKFVIKLKKQKLLLRRSLNKKRKRLQKSTEVEKIYRMSSDKSIHSSDNISLNLSNKDK